MSTLIEETRAAAQGRWRDILNQVGIDDSYLKNLHGPCPICRDGKDRFRWDDKDGHGTYYCGQCGSGSGIHLVERYLGISCVEACKKVRTLSGAAQVRQIAAQKTEEDKAAVMRRMWNGARPITQGDPAWRYLESRCGDVSAVQQDLRYHPALKHTMGGTHPALLARMVDLAGPKVAGLHRTFLTPDGRKADIDPVRMSFGDLNGFAVRLGGVQERLGIAEGIETAICAGKLFGAPCWAALSANGMKTWEPPPEVRCVLICGDNDASYTGQEAAYALAHRLTRQGISVEVHLPQLVGTDFADVQMEGVA